MKISRLIIIACMLAIFSTFIIEGANAAETIVYEMDNWDGLTQYYKTFNSTNDFYLDNGNLTYKYPSVNFSFQNETRVKHNDNVTGNSSATLKYYSSGQWSSVNGMGVIVNGSDYRIFHGWGGFYGYPWFYITKNGNMVASYEAYDGYGTFTINVTSTSVKLYRGSSLMYTDTRSIDTDSYYYYFVGGTRYTYPGQSTAGYFKVDSLTINGIFDTTYYVNGTVVDQINSTPISGVNLTLWTNNTSVINTTSDSSGYYKLNVKDPGNYTIRINIPGYWSYQKMIANPENFTVQHYGSYYCINNISLISLSGGIPDLSIVSSDITFEKVI